MESDLFFPITIGHPCPIFSTCCAQSLHLSILGDLCPTLWRCVSGSLRPHELQPARFLCSWGFSRQEYWSGLPCPPPGYLPNSGFKPRSPSLQADSLPSEPPGKPNSPHGSQFIRTQILGGKKNPCGSSDPPSRLRLRPLHCFPCSECTTSAAGLSL